MNTAATALLNQTGNILLVKDALGHSSVRSTEIYTRLADGLVRAAVDGLPV